MRSQMLSDAFRSRPCGRLFDLEHQLCVFLQVALTLPSELVGRLKMLQYSRELLWWIAMPCCVVRDDLVLVLVERNVREEDEEKRVSV